VEVVRPRLLGDLVELGVDAPEDVRLQHVVEHQVRERRGADVGTGELGKGALERVDVEQLLHHRDRRPPRPLGGPIRHHGHVTVRQMAGRGRG
jgi:hypothetical protein